MRTSLFAYLTLSLSCAGSLFADPQITSWMTDYSAKYARIYETDAAKLAGTAVTTWTNGSQVQDQPAYVGLQKISYSESWIYIQTNNLAGYVMGPWYMDAARTRTFVNLPAKQYINYRIPRSSTLSTPPTTKSKTNGQEDAIGYLVDGVAMFDPTDGFTYSNGSEASPGSGEWHRDAYVNEGITFDPANTHQQNTGKYHNHANPIALRYLLGDNVSYNSDTKTYQEKATAPTKHSPIIGWIRDGYPIYGPYGYDDPSDPTSGVRRMISGFVKRDGTKTGVDNISTTGRTLPAWATRTNGGITATGPTVSTTYPLGRYIEDWAYLGDLVKSGSTKYQQGTDFDLNEYNVRFCVTPEFPEGTYAYFVAIDSAGGPTFPYNLNRYFFGSPTGGSITPSETVDIAFEGGENFKETAQIATAAKSGNVTITWTSAEGGVYQVEASEDLKTWESIASSQQAAANSRTTKYTDLGAGATYDQRYYRVTRESLAEYDDSTDSGGTGGGGGGGGGGDTTQGISTIAPTTGARGATVSLSITLNPQKMPPPNAVAPTGVTLTKSGAATITASSFSRDSSTGVVTASFTVPANATTGTYTVTATFGPNSWMLTDGFTVN